MFWARVAKILRRGLRSLDKLEAVKAAERDKSLAGKETKSPKVIALTVTFSYFTVSHDSFLDPILAYCNS